MPAKKYRTLDDHRRAVECATAGSLPSARAHARKFCEARGIEIPDWCAFRAPGAFVRHPTPETHEQPTIDLPTALDALRRSWRGPSKAFSLRPDRVTLIDLSEGSTRRGAAFDTVDAALQAIAANAIDWAPLRSAERRAFAI